MRRLALAVLRLYCLDCKGVIWRWQSRCGSYHSTCKHDGDAFLASRSGIPRWSCALCGR